MEVACTIVVDLILIIKADICVCVCICMLQGCIPQILYTGNYTMLGDIEFK